MGDIDYRRLAAFMRSRQIESADVAHAKLSIACDAITRAGLVKTIREARKILAEADAWIYAEDLTALKAKIRAEWDREAERYDRKADEIEAGTLCRCGRPLPIGFVRCPLCAGDAVRSASTQP